MALNLPSLDAAVHTLRPNAKPVTRKTLKGRKDRAETKVKGLVRAHVEARDGYCLIATEFPVARQLADTNWHCEGWSEWVHMHSHRRSKTRGQAPERRHTTAASFKACTKHHDMYDGRKHPRLFVTALSRKGADGPLKYRFGK